MHRMSNRGSEGRQIVLCAHPAHVPDLKTGCGCSNRSESEAGVSKRPRPWKICFVSIVERLATTLHSTTGALHYHRAARGSPRAASTGDALLHADKPECAEPGRGGVPIRLPEQGPHWPPPNHLPPLSSALLLAHCDRFHRYPHPLRVKSPCIFSTVPRGPHGHRRKAKSAGSRPSKSPPTPFGRPE